MNGKIWLGCLVSLLLAASGAAAETVAGLPLHIQRLDDQAIRLWIGDTISSTATVAIATDDGILVIDTTGYPRVDAELRKIIAREFGRSDFKVLIDTHEHGDHTGGNAVYADCTIIGHELVAAGMAAAAGDAAEINAWYTTRITELQRDLATQVPDSPAARRLQEELTLAELGLEAGAAPSEVPPPTRTFKDRLTLNLGDTAVELSYIGGMHTASDIAVFVPKHGLLLTGDTMADVWLTDTPGCLASFMARPGVRHDFPLLLENWDRLLAKKDSIRLLLPGHWNGELTFQGFAARVDYVKTLWNAVNAGFAAGENLTDLLAQYRLDTRFPELAASPGFNRNNNSATIFEMWSVVTGQESAADRLYTLIDSEAGDAAIRQVLAARDAKPAKYYYVEGQFVYVGYRFLQEDKARQAVALFKLVVELYPDSWNAYDSLGEAHLNAGDPGAAAAMYEKSLALNPDNTNGRDALARIRAAGSVE